MKKILFSLLTIGLMASMSSCNSEEDMPKSGTPETTPLEASFPKGATTRTVRMNIPKDVRTRADEFPFWDTFNNETGTLFIRYAVYNEDGSLFYSTDAASALPTTTSKEFDLTIPVNESGNMKLFVWADKIGNHGSSTQYTINWENKTVSMPYNASPINNDMGKLGDAWCVWGETTDFFEHVSPSGLTLTRPLMQINLLSDEMQIPGVHDKYYESGVLTSVLFSETSESSGMWPHTWHWDTNEFDFVSLGMCMGNNHFYFYPNRNPAKATINGRNFDYLACAYVFGSTSDEYKDAATGKTFGYVRFACGKPTGTEKKNVVSAELPQKNANMRLIYCNKPIDSPDNDGGILNPGGTRSVSLIVDEAFGSESGENYVKN